MTAYGSRQAHDSTGANTARAAGFTYVGTGRGIAAAEAALIDYRGALAIQDLRIAN